MDAGRIFIVEDEALIAMELQDRLTQLGYEIVGLAARGEKALELLPQARPDVVLMDINLAGRINGIETARSLRALVDASVVFVSAYSDDALIRQSGEVQPFGYLVKPVEERTLHATVQMALYHRRTQRELAQQRQALERLNQELRQFLHLASHDLQEPLRKITAFAELLREDLGEALTGTVAVDLRHILESVNQMRQRLLGLLAYDQASQPLQCAPLDLNDCVDQALQFHESALAERQAVLVRDALPTIHGDARQLCQVYAHLIDNALKFTPHHQPRLHFTVEAAADWWTLGLRDNGPGIKPAFHEVVFAPFEQLHGPKRGGTGIGLTLCRKVVENHGGRIWVESGPEQGAHIRFTLPHPTANA